MKRHQKIDIADMVILVGFCVFSYGVAEKYTIPDMCLVSGGLLVLVGLFFAIASSRMRESE